MINVAMRAPRFWYHDSPLAILLQPVAYVFRVITALRRAAFRSGLLRREAVPVPVLVVGNITVGGSGKTPLVAWLATQLCANGYKPGIVSRGYGGRANRRPAMVTAASKPGDVGDEPVVLARRARVPVCIGVDRVAAARHLLAETDVDIVISDDGLQHYRLARDLEFAVLDAQRMLGNGRLLPAGPLREAPARLREIDLLFINGQSDCPDAHCFTLVPDEAIELGTENVRALSEFHGVKVWSVAGIGNPARFHDMLASFGIEPICVDVPDHGVISLSSLRGRAPYPILMTEKDAVKYFSESVTDAWYVPVNVRMPETAQHVVMQLIQSTFDREPTGG